MRDDTPSRTAWGAAVQRALHQDEPPGRRILVDPLAWRIVGGRDAVDPTLWVGSRLQTFIAVRHRFAQDCLAVAVERGTRQLVLLGAGLDTLAHRLPGSGLSVWEVDHPATSTWKQQLVAEAGLAGPVRYVPVDFERASFLDGLTAAGFDAGSPAFFVWLGVTPYLTHDAVRATLAAIASLPGGEVVFEHTTPDASLSGEAAAERADLARRVADLGEPLVGPWPPDRMDRLLAELGYTEVETLGRAEIRVRYLGRPAGEPRPDAGRLVRARRPPAG